MSNIYLKKQVYGEIIFICATYGDIAQKIISIDYRLSEHDQLIDKIISAINDLIKVTKDNETKRIGF